MQVSITTAHALIVGAVCGVFLGAALWFGAPSLVAGKHPIRQTSDIDAQQVYKDVVLTPYS